MSGKQRLGLLGSAIAVIAVVALTTYVLSAWTPGALSPTRTAQATRTTPSTHTPLHTVQGAGIATSRKPQPGPDPAEMARWQGQLASEFHRVADIYQQMAKFPPYSVPITPQSVKQFHYNQYFPVTIPLDTPDGHVQIKVLLQQLHFQKGDSIVGVASISGSASNNASLDSVSILSDKNAVLYSSSLSASDKGNGYAIVIDPPAGSTSDWPSNLLLRVSGSAGNHSIAAVAPFFYDDPIGKVSDVGDASIDGPNLVIPVTLDLEGDGYYAVSGDLYSTDGQPLVHLETKAQLSKFDDNTTLKAHRAALQETGNAGPYVLKDLMIRKLPDKPGDRTLFGPTNPKKFPVQGFPFNQYSQQPWTDPMTKARLEFLRSAQPG